MEEYTRTLWYRLNADWVLHPHNKVAKENIFKGLRFYRTSKPRSKPSYWQKIGDFCLETEDFVPHSTEGSFECLHLFLPLGRRWIPCSQWVWVTSKFRKLLSFKSTPQNLPHLYQGGWYYLCYSQQWTNTPVSQRETLLLTSKTIF